MMPALWTLTARDELTVGSIANPGLITGVVQVTGQARSDVISGLDTGASLAATSVAGDLRITGSRTPLLPSTDPRNISSDLQRHDGVSNVLRECRGGDRERTRLAGERSARSARSAVGRVVA